MSFDLETAINVLGSLGFDEASAEDFLPYCTGLSFELGVVTNRRFLTGWDILEVSLFFHLGATRVGHAAATSTRFINCLADELDTRSEREPVNYQLIMNLFIFVAPEEILSSNFKDMAEGIFNLLLRWMSLTTDFIEHRRCCRTLSAADSQRESIRLGEGSQQVITRSLLYDKLAQRNGDAAPARVAADRTEQGHDLARAT